MRSAVWLLTRLLSKLLQQDSEQEAILGDLEERRLAGCWRGLWDLFSLVVLRQAQLWMSWRPWITFLFLFLPLSSAVQAAESILQVLLQQPLESYTMRAAILSATILCFALAWCGGFSAVRIGRFSAWAVIGAILLVSHLAIWISHPAMAIWLLCGSAILIGVPTFLGAVCARSSSLSTSNRLILFLVQVAAWCGLFFAEGAPPPPISQDLLLIPLLLWPVAVPLVSTNMTRAAQ